MKKDDLRSVLTRRRFLESASAATALVVAGCSGDSDDPGSPSDAAGSDSFFSDAGMGDAGMSDAGAMDAGLDAGSDSEMDSAEVEEETWSPPDDLPEYSWDGPLGPETLFGTGIATGDPTPDGMVLWTRLDDVEGETEAFWEMALDPDFETRAAAGWTGASAARDYTVKVEVTDLPAHTTFYYRFWAMGRASATGRTRTAPSGAVDQLRFAVASCSNYSNGWFHCYADIAKRRDLDAVLHLGDYFYESGGGSLRKHDPAKEIITLDDYRTRYRQYRRDADLQELHRQHPVIPIWDDHESANNAWKDGAQNHSEGPEGLWTDRKAAAMKAWAEYMPVREADDGRIYRRLKFGHLLDLIMLDTRLWGRDQQIDPNVNFDTLNDPLRTLLGAEQEAWLTMQLMLSTSTWRVIGQQVMIAPLLAAGEVLNFDQWDGYPAARQRLLDHIKDNAIDNVVVLTGDIHSSWASEIPLDYDEYSATGEGSVGVEFVAPGITSGFPLSPDLVQFAIQLNPHIKYGDVEHRGYFVLDITESRTQAAWFHTDTVTDAEHTISFSRAFRVDSGTNTLIEDIDPAPERESAPELAP